MNLETLELTAFHEAAHAVLAIRSSYHIVSGDLTISADGAGEAPIGASEQKLVAAGKPTDPALLLADPDYIRELVRILFAGILAEKIRAQEVSADRVLRPNLKVSGAPDIKYAQKVMHDAVLDFQAEKDELKKQSEGLVHQEWQLISTLADMMLFDPSVPLSRELARFAATKR